MRGRSLTIAGIFAAAVAAILILCYKSINLMGVTITCGILFVAAGLINMIFFGYRTANESSKVLNLVSNAAAIVLGISMLVFRVEFRPMIAFMFGLLVAVCALWQFFVLAVGARPYQLPAWLYLFPVLLAGGSVYIFLTSHNDDSMMILSTGIAMAVLGLGCLIEGSILGVARHNHEKASSESEQPRPSQPQTSSESATSEGQAYPSITDSVRQNAPATETKRKKIETTDDLDDEIKDPTIGE